MHPFRPGSRHYAELGIMPGPCIVPGVFEKLRSCQESGPWSTIPSGAMALKCYA